MSAVLTDVKIDIQHLVDELLGKRLVVHNDDINSFDWVIESLVAICNHSVEQAEQCAYIIHFKGKYAVKEGPTDQLRPMREALVDRGINATLD